MNIENLKDKMKHMVLEKINTNYPNMVLYLEFLTQLYVSFFGVGVGGGGAQSFFGEEVG